MKLTEHLHRLTASREELEADEARRDCELPGCTHAADLVPRHRATVAGTVTALTYRPKDQTPAMTARVSDGTGTVDLVFLGRRDVPGIDPGRRLVAEGMVCAPDGDRAAMFNPAYRLLPRSTERASA
ncbi:hypothetical protein GCM10023169_40010 [Georgenia halophila]|uniref:ATP-dependent DNA helicase RecG n=1 Tax=Georgenia halophila TaxID=620889 RepID=A0ABP8LNS5_9MICO